MAKAHGFNVYLNVTNLDKSALFYGGLGFKKAMEYPEPMRVIAYEVGNSTLLIGPSDVPGQPATTRAWLAHKPWGVGAVLMPQVKDVDAVYAMARAMGAEVEEPPTLQPWGSKTLQLVDPDGYSLMFEQTQAGAPGAAAAKTTRRPVVRKAGKKAGRTAAKGARKLAKPSKAAKSPRAGAPAKARKTATAGKRAKGGTPVKKAGRRTRS